MPEILAIDAGHGWIKALAGDGQRVIFPSLICPAPAAVDLGEYARSETVLIDGIPHLVGDPARRHATPLWSRDKAADPDTLRLILVVAARLGAVGPVTLATGLPLAWFGPQRKAFREALVGYGAAIALPGQPPQRLWFESVRVLPQGLVAALNVLLPADYEPGSYLVADIGYRTTDFLTIEKTSHGIDADPAQAGSLELGMHAVTAAVSAGLEHDYQVPFAPAELEGIDRVHVHGMPVPLADRRAAALDQVRAQLRERLREQLGTAWPKLAGIVLVGGGAEAMQSAFPRAVVPERSQWANAEAYLGALVLA